MRRPIPAHFDGERILLDEPVALLPNTRLLVTVVTPEEEEQEDWYRLSLVGLDRAYGNDEPEYSLDDLKSGNPDYDGR
jgi:hypothetical protein